MRHMRRWSEDEKMQMMEKIEVLRKTMSLESACRQLGIKGPRYFQWKRNIDLYGTASKMASKKRSPTSIAPYLETLAVAHEAPNDTVEIPTAVAKFLFENLTKSLGL